MTTKNPDAATDFERGLKMLGRSSIGSCVLLGALASVTTGARAADSADGDTLSEIVVTAQKRVESIQEVPTCAHLDERDYFGGGSGLPPLSADAGCEQAASAGLR